MTAYYTIFGRKFASNQLALATFGTIIGGVVLASSGKKTPTEPVIQASSSEEEKYIMDFLKEQEAEAAKKH